MTEWLREPGFAGTHATMGADISQLMAMLFTVLFLVGGVQAKRGNGTGHHWLMLGGMAAMLAFFTSYYLFRQLGVLAFEGKEGFGGSQALYENVFVPLLTFHILLVVIGLIMAMYMIVLGFRSQVFQGTGRVLKEEILAMSWKGAVKSLGLLVGSLIMLSVLLAVFGWLKPSRVIVGLVLLVMVALVQLLEWGVIQRIWPNGARRHRVLGRLTIVVYCVLFVTGSATYAMLYIVYPGRIG